MGMPGDAFAHWLVSYPVAHLNPFQHLLYTAAETCGFRVLPALRLDGLEHVGWARRMVLHLHWLGALLRGCQSAAEAMEAVHEIDQRLAGWRKRGYRIVWTVHNILPHNHQHAAAEIALRKVVARRSHLIHVMSENTGDAVAGHYRLPDDKVFHVPHPSYQGWYPALIGKTAARGELGLGAGDFVFLFFGSIQPYKGLLELVEAYDALRRKRPGARLRLIIAGTPTDAAYCEAVSSKVGGRPDVVFLPRKVDEARVQELFSASDVVVAPYRATLNSGVALLAATFRRMVVAPRQGAMAETFRQDDALLYDADSGEGLVDAMERALAHRVQENVLDALLSRHAPFAVSTAFFAALRGRLDLAEH